MPNLTFNKMHLCGKVQTENGKKIKVTKKKEWLM